MVMLTELAGASFLVAGFLILFKLLNLMEQARDTLTASRLSLFEISRRDIDDEEKEKNLRAHSLNLLKAIAALMLGSIMAAGLPLVILWGLDIVDLISLEATLRTASSWPFLLIATIVTLGVFWRSFQRQRGHHTEATAFENRYSGSTRILHNLAFASVPVQLALADLEDAVYLKHTDADADQDPVFITSLPRAGTTLLLELCFATGEFATHSYRYMPFVFTPVLWQRLTKRMQTTGEYRERAHGDGMLVNEDSPEAFEEMLWMAHWDRPYDKHRISPWQLSEHPDFLKFFRNHMRKVVYLSHIQTRTTARRYVSKNNLNIARIDWLLSQLPTAKIVIPFRHPLHHAESLLRQHLRFLAIHESDPFARHYMAAIGHFDFGANLRPVNFDNWLDDKALPPATDINFWIAYWIAAYRHLLAKPDANIIFVDYDALCHEPQQTLCQLAGFLQLTEPERLIGQHDRLQIKSQRSHFDSTIQSHYSEQAHELHEQLKARSRLNITETGRVTN